MSLKNQSAKLRHSGAGRNPDRKEVTREAGQWFCPLRGIHVLLDSGLRRNDELG